MDFRESCRAEPSANRLERARMLLHRFELLRVANENNLESVLLRLAKEVCEFLRTDHTRLVDYHYVRQRVAVGMDGLRHVGDRCLLVLEALAIEKLPLLLLEVAKVEKEPFQGHRGDLRLALHGLSCDSGWRTADDPQAKSVLPDCPRGAEHGGLSGSCSAVDTGKAGR